VATKKRIAKPAAKANGKTARPSAAAEPMDAMMEAWQKAASPGEGHRRLEPLVGNWRTRTTFWCAPGAPASISEGLSKHRWVLGGRYLEQAYRGSAMGCSFEGLGYTAYDNVRSRYFGTWMDSLGTGIMFNTGVGKPQERRISFVGTTCDPESGRDVEMESQIQVQDRDHHTYEMWTKLPDGKRFRTMLVEYTRKKG
jgi:hypothetical protein